MNKETLKHLMITYKTPIDEATEMLTKINKAILLNEQSRKIMMDAYEQMTDLSQTITSLHKSAVRRGTEQSDERD